MNKNYIIAVDETGEPFIAHKYAYESGVAGRGHKYVQRVKLSNGKYRYFYSQKEYEAYLGLTKRKREIKERMDQIVREQDRLSSEYAKKKVYDNYKSAVEKYGKTSMQAQKALDEHNVYARKFGELQDEWDKLRSNNIRTADALRKYED